MSHRLLDESGGSWRDLHPGLPDASRTTPECRIPMAEIHGSDVLLIEDTWTAGGHAQSAAHTLSEAGARRMGLIVIGRHIHRDRDIPNSDATNAEMLSQLPKRFDWSTCAVHPS